MVTLEAAEETRVVCRRLRSQNPREVPGTPSPEKDQFSDLISMLNPHTAP